MVSINSNDGFSERAISAKMHCTKTAAHKIIANFNDHWSYKGLNINGRPMKTFPRNDRIIKRITVSSIISSLKKICVALL